MSTPELPVEKPTNTVRIAFFGGSSTAGTGVNISDVKTWPWQAVDMLRKHTSRQIDFINAAVGGYTSFESYGRLWSRVRHYRPDIVVINHGWNEMYYFAEAANIHRWRTHPDGSWSLGTTGRPIASYAPHWIDPMIRWSQVLSRVRRRLSSATSGELGSRPKGVLAVDFDRSGLSIWRTNLRLIRETCAVLDARLFVIKQATLIVPGLSDEQRRRCRYEYHGFDHNAHVNAFGEVYRVIEEEIAQDSIIDLTSMSGRPGYFADHIHPTPLGCQKIAAEVSRALALHIERQLHLDQTSTASSLCKGVSSVENSDDSSVWSAP